MRPISIVLSSLVLFACQSAATDQPAQVTRDKAEPIEAKRVPEPLAAKKKQLVVRKDLLAEDLPPVPVLEQLAVPELAAGELRFPDDADELAPRAALALRDGLLIVGQAYHGRRPGVPSKSWRWAGFIPEAGGEPRSTLYDPGAIRAGIVSEGEGAVTGVSGFGYDVRGWFAKVKGDGTITEETALDTPSSTEMFDLVPGRAEGELVVLGGYVDAQGWLISLDASGQRRWEKYVGSYGSTQIRALARLDSGDLLLVGLRGHAFGEAWSAIAPGDGGSSAAPDDVTQTKIEIENADPNRMLRAIVSLGEAGYLALGTAKRNHLQAHDQLFAVGFSRTGELAWSRVLDGVRVIDVLGARALAGAAQFVVTVPLVPLVPLDHGSALALVTVPSNPEAEVVAVRLVANEGWTSAGFVEGGRAPELLAYQASDGGVAWRRLGPG